MIALHPSHMSYSIGQRQNLLPNQLREWHYKKRGTEGNMYLYLRGSCFRISKMVDMAYRPVSSVNMRSKPDPLPAPDTAVNTCTHREVE